MPLEKLPTTSLDDVNHRRRARETINKVLSHEFDDSRVTTTAEKLAGVTVINSAFPPGDVRRYGAKGYPTDDTAPFQAAINSAGAGSYRGAVYIPAGAWLITSTLTIGSAADNAKPIWIYGDGEATQIINNAAASNPTFRFTGVKHWRASDFMLLGDSSFPNDGIRVNTSGNAGIRWEISNVTSLMAGRGLVLEDTNTGGIYCFRHWPDSVDNALIVTPTVNSTDVDHGIYMTGSFCMDILIERADCCPRTNFKANARGIYCDATGPNHTIRVIASVVQSSGGSTREGIRLTNCNDWEISAYNESSRIAIVNSNFGELHASGNGGVEGSVLLASNSLENTFIGVQNAAVDINDNTCLRNTFIGCNFATSFNDASVGTTRFFNCSGPTFDLIDYGGLDFFTLTYSASITPNRRNGEWQRIVANDGTAFTINAITNLWPGCIVEFTIYNTHTAALGAVTWNSIYHLAGAWVQPLNGFNRSVRFRYDGSVLDEICRTAADVAN